MKVYRGLRDQLPDGLYENKYLSQPRKPKDVKIFIHEVSDSWFYKKFSIKARSETIFCTLSLDQARDYGVVYELKIPEGDRYYIVYSKEVSDFIATSNDVEDTNDALSIIEWLESKNYEVVDSFEKIPIDFKGEMMLMCNRYYLYKV